ncbi:MAG: sigma-70 family RNA polymerase sigma factor, partial [Clostridiales bacterium]|nr:sigma-70 family RNA polymerase sigma factor [Clostridiales bacterium]
MTVEQGALLDAARKGDRDACAQILEENQRLVWAIVRRYTGRGVEAEDLFQLGCIGFLKALQGYDPAYGTQFSTYAVPKIAGEIRRFLRDDGAVKVSRTVKEQAARIYLEAETLREQLRREPTVTELAAATGLTPEEIAAAETATASVSSLQAENEDGLTLETALGDEGMEDRVLEHLALREAVARLPERERTVILLRYYKGYTQQRAAQVVGRCISMVSSVERVFFHSRNKLGYTGAAAAALVGPQNSGWNQPITKEGQAMKKRAKRLTALLLSLAMALSMLSATAWATNGSDTGTGTVSATTSTTGTGDSATSSDSSSAVAGSMGILDALDSTTLSAMVAVAEAEAAAAASANDGIATISDDEDEETDIMLAEAEEEAGNITVIDEDGESTGLTDEELQTVLYLYSQYLDNYNENVGYLGRQTPWFTSYEEDSDDGLGPLGSMLVLAGVTVDDVRNGNYTYDELVGTIYTFWYGNKYGVEYYGSDIIAAKNDALSAVEESGATTYAQQLLVLNDWLADNVSFDMAYIMNMSSDDYDMMSAPVPVNSEHYEDLYNVFYEMYYDTMVESYGSDYGPVYAQYAAAQMVTAVEGMWNGCLIGALALGKGVCMAYTSAYTYLVQWMNPDVYSVDGTLTTNSSSWKTVEELNYVTTTEDVTTTSTDWDGVTYYSVTEDSSEGEEGDGTEGEEGDGTEGEEGDGTEGE